MQITSGVYSIEEVSTGRKYIGSSVDIRKRWREHKRQLESGTHHSKFLQRCWSKRGPENFTFKLLLICAREDTVFYEQQVLDATRPKFNSVPTAGSMLGYLHTAASRAKMSASRPKDFSPMKGKSHTEESRQKISEGRKGKGGGKRPAYWIENLSRAQKGRVILPAHRAKISATLKGHKQGPEQIEKRMLKIRGRKMPDGFAEAQSQRRKGMKFEADHCVNIGRAKAKLTDDQVREIRLLLASGEKQKPISILFGVDPSVISTINTKTAYAWVD